MPSWRLALGSVLMFTATLATVVGIAYARTDIPEDLNAFATQQDTVYYWADGTPMARTGWVSRQEMPLSKIPDHVRWAVLAAENADFYSDHGISTQGITRALWRTVGDGDTQGGSTITQQYVKNVYLSQDQSFSRKFTEMLLAVKLDSRLSKDEILQEYLNTSWFGRGTYGLQRASQAYYGKEVTQLNASEGAFLASLLKGASLYDPAVRPSNHERAVERWRWTLDRMVEIGRLSPAERATYTTFPEPKPPHRPNSAGGQNGYLVQLAESYAKRAGHISDARFDLGGYQIYTTFEKPRMTALTRSVRDARKALDPKRRKADRYVRFGASTVAADGRILAVYGGPDFEKQAFNESNAGTVPAGSAFTPFVYAAGLQHGVTHERNGPRSTVTPETEYDGDDDIPVMTPEGPYWDRSGKMVKGDNDGDESFGRIGLHDAMAKSVNSPSSSSAWTRGSSWSAARRRRRGCCPPASARRSRRSRWATPPPAPSGWQTRTARSRPAGCTRIRTRSARSPATANRSGSTCRSRDAPSGPTSPTRSPDRSPSPARPESRSSAPSPSRPEPPRTTPRAGTSGTARPPPPPSSSTAWT